MNRRSTEPASGAFQRHFSGASRMSQEPNRPPSTHHNADPHAKARRDGKNSKKATLWQSQKEKRKKQLQLLRTFSPTILHLKDNAIPSSTTKEEIEQRKKEVQYRIDLIKALLDITQGELDLLSSTNPLNALNTTK